MGLVLPHPISILLLMALVSPYLVELALRIYSRRCRIYIKFYYYSSYKYFLTIYPSIKPSLLSTIL